MSPTVTTPDETTTEEVITDDSRISDESAFNKARERFLNALKSARSKFVSATNAIKSAAEESVNLRSLILLPSGNPDWSAKSDAYRLNMESAVNEVLGSLAPSERRRFLGSMRQHVARTYLDPAIVAWVQANVQGMADRDESEEPFKTQVRRQYESAGLAVPPKWQRAGAATSGGGPEAGSPASPAAALDNALGGLSQVTGDHASLALLRAISALHSNLTGKSARFGESGPEHVSQVLTRIAVVAQVTAKRIAGKELTEQEEERLASALYDPKSDATD